MEQEDNINKLVNDVEEYIETQKQLSKLYIVEKISVATSSIASNLIIVSFFMLMFLFLNVSAAFMISDYYGKTYLGFSVIGLFYFIGGIILYLKRNSWLKTPISNSLISKMLNHE